MKREIERLFAVVSTPANLILSVLGTGFIAYVLATYGDRFFQELELSFPFFAAFPIFLIGGGYIWAKLCRPTIGIVASLIIYLFLSFLAFAFMRAVNF